MSWLNHVEAVEMQNYDIPSTSKSHLVTLAGQNSEKTCQPWNVSVVLSHNFEVPLAWTQTSPESMQGRRSPGFEHLLLRQEYLGIDNIPVRKAPAADEMWEHQVVSWGADCGKVWHWDSHLVLIFVSKMEAMLIPAFARINLTMIPFLLLRPGVLILGNVSRDEGHRGRIY